jgi:hypothetical protein
MYSSTLSFTLALDKDWWVKLRLGRFTPANDPILIVLAGGRALVRSVVVQNKFRPPLQFGPQDTQTVVICYTD